MLEPGPGHDHEAETMAEDNVTSDLPWQVRAIGLIGVPAVIALFLVWLLATKNADALSKTSDALPRIEIAIGAHIKQMEDFDRRSEEHENRLESYMQLFCVNSAKTEVARNACFNVR